MIDAATIDEFIQEIYEQSLNNECYGEEDAFKFLQQINSADISPELCSFIWCLANIENINLYFTFDRSVTLHEENMNVAMKANDTGDTGIYYQWLFNQLQQFGFNDDQLDKFTTIVGRYGHILYDKVM
ncbi:MAG: hypothetical protein LLG02_03375 [Pelosinus sp.]|nr:hypothetical protein [Pelosinus sp.]